MRLGMPNLSLSGVASAIEESLPALTPTYHWTANSVSGVADDAQFSPWTDRIASLDAAADTDDDRPILRSAELNDQDVVDFFDDSNNFALQTAAFSTSLGTAFTLHCVAQFGNTNGVLFDGLSGSTRAVIYGKGTPAKYSIHRGIDLDSDLSVDTGWHVFTLTSSGSTSKLYIDGVKILDGSASIEAFTGLTMGANFTLGASFAQGQQAEYVIYDSAHSEANILTVVEYLKTKYDVRRGVWDVLNDNHGPVVNSVANPFVADVPNGSAITKSLDLDGTDDYVNCGDVADLSFEWNQAITFSGWVKSSTAAAFRTIFAKQQGSGDVRGYFFAISDGDQQYFILQNNVSNRIIVRGTADVADDAWHHVVVTHDGSGTTGGCKFYLDGDLDALVVVAGAGISATMDNSEPAAIGARALASTPALFANGGVLDIRAAKGVLSAIAISALHANRPGGDLLGGEIAVWYCDGEQTDVTWTTTASDVKGAVDGTLTNFGTPGTDKYPYSANVGAEDWGVARVLPFVAASSQYVNVGDEDGLSFESTDAFSVSAWIKISSLAAYRSIIGKMGTSEPFQGWDFGVNTTGKLVIFLINDNAGNNKIRVDGTTVLSTGTWYHVGVTYDGSEAASGVAIYLDGVAETVTETSDTLTSSIDNSDVVCIGSRNPTSYYFDGSLSSIGIIGNEASAAEMDNLYDAKPGQDPDNLFVYFWPLDGETTAPSWLTEAVDVIGTNDGTLTGWNAKPWVPDVPRDSHLRRSLSISGDDQYVNMGRMASTFESQSKYSISVWIKQDTLDAVRYLFRKGAAQSTSIAAFSWTNGRFYVQPDFNQSNRMYIDDYSLNVTAGQWHHVVIVFDGTGATNADRLKIYVDGVEPDVTYEGTIPAATGTDSNAFTLSVNSSTTAWNGHQLDFRIFKGIALDGDDASLLFTNGAGGALLGNESSQWKLDGGST